MHLFQKEEKQLESTVNALIQRVQDIKNSIAGFLIKLENEYQTLNWYDRSCYCNNTLYFDKSGSLNTDESITISFQEKKTHSDTWHTCMNA